MSFPGVFLLDISSIVSLEIQGREEFRKKVKERERKRDRGKGAREGDGDAIESSLMQRDRERLEARLHEEKKGNHYQNIIYCEK